MRTPTGTAFVIALALVGSMLGACSSSGGDSRTIEVDSGHDELAGTFRAFFPRDVTVKPGMTLKFHQTWTGEPHTITAGTEVEDRVKPDILPIILRSKSTEPPDSESFGPVIDAEVQRFFGELPFFFGEKGVNQAVGQPCVLKTGLPKSEKACATKTEPGFTGTESFFNSGFIPYRGTQGNQYDMKIADNAKPGTYFYFCALHGPGMSGQITITKSGNVPSQATLNKQARDEIEAIAKPLLAQLRKEQAGNGEFEGNLAGSGIEANSIYKGQVNEFTPSTIKAKVGEPVTWTFIQNHTISFNVPPYVPYYDVQKNGTVVASESINEPHGGWPGRNPPTEDGSPDEVHVLPAVHVDAGKWDGSGGLHSSGIDWQTGDTYTVTFTKPGTYPMACLVHPGMIGKVVIS